MAIREDQVAAKSLGVETSVCKCMNFMYGAFWAGIIGAAYAPFVNYIESSQFTTDTGFNVLAMVVIGGQGTLLGPILDRPLSPYSQKPCASWKTGDM